VKQFVSGLESHIKDRNQFKNCLLPCTPVRTEGSRSEKTYFVFPFRQSQSLVKYRVLLSRVTGEAIASADKQ